MGEKLRAARMAAGLTQVELAERMGCKQKDISRWENGRPMTVETLKKLAKSLGISMEYLV